MADAGLERLNLDVYDTRDGLWNPELGELQLPDGWEFLSAGDAFITRHVKAAGVYWVLWQPRGKNRPHRRQLGVCAPISTIEQARARAAATEQKRADNRVVNRASRDRAEARYRVELARAVRAWLEFPPEQSELADDIARGVADHAAVVDSGRVGRVRTLTLEERARLAARAYIRHRYTDYEHRLGDLDLFLAEIDDVDYREIKNEAHDAVDQFLTEHRRHA